MGTQLKFDGSQLNTTPMLSYNSLIPVMNGKSSSNHWITVLTISPVWAWGMVEDVRFGSEADVLR